MDEISEDVRIRIAAVEAAGRQLPPAKPEGDFDPEAAATRVVQAADKIAGYIKTGRTYW